MELQKKMDYMELKHEYSTYTDFMRDSLLDFLLMKLIYQCAGKPWESLYDAWIGVVGSVGPGGIEIDIMVLLHKQLVLVDEPRVVVPELGETSPASL